MNEISARPDSLHVRCCRGGLVFVPLPPLNPHSPPPPPTPPYPLPPLPTPTHSDHFFSFFLLSSFHLLRSSHRVACLACTEPREIMQDCFFFFPFSSGRIPSTMQSSAFSFQAFEDGSVVRELKLKFRREVAAEWMHNYNNYSLGLIRS